MERCIDDELPFEIPESWAWVRLGTVLEIARGGSPRPIQQYLTTESNGVSWIKIGDADKGGKYIYKTKEKICPEGVTKSRMVHSGDFLLTNSMNFGRPYILKTDGCIHDGWLVLSNRFECYSVDFLYYILSSPFAYYQFCGTVEISALEKAIKSYEKHEKDADRFITLIDKYENFDKLTIAMLNEFIEKILVHERDRKGSIQTTQEVEIYFNFVGRFVPPAFGEVELTQEELEAIRKREERKDRLHQNYLKRKASGAQKRYEDKIKERKKAEIEAKKAAIRAEDIAKGVFVPVSSLPQREPMKGVQTA